tara:strand:- start:21 stop:629 length:609 start_codon:yes stop_codon:yes gene_type:complete
LIARSADDWEKKLGFMQSFSLKLTTRSCGFSNDDKYLLTGGESETIDVWNLTEVVSDEWIQGVNNHNVKRKVRESPDKRLRGHNSWINCIRFVKKENDEYFNSTDIFASGDILGKVLIWRLDTEQVLWACRTHLSIVTSMSFMEEGKKIVTSGIDGKLNFWDLSNVVFENGGNVVNKGYESSKIDDNCYNMKKGGEREERAK